jgi:hypothetical protein
VIRTRNRGSLLLRGIKVRNGAIVSGTIVRGGRFLLIRPDGLFKSYRGHAVECQWFDEIIRRVDIPLGMSGGHGALIEWADAQP